MHERMCNFPLNGWKIVTSVCPDDVCKKKKEEEDVMHSEQLEERANQKPRHCRLGYPAICFS